MDLLKASKLFQHQDVPTEIVSDLKSPKPAMLAVMARLSQVRWGDAGPGAVGVSNLCPPATSICPPIPGEGEWAREEIGKDRAG